MRFEGDIPDSMDLGFELVEPGTYVWQITDNIDLSVNEESGSKSIRIPLIVDTVIKGDTKAVGKQGSMMINVRKKDGDINDFGERQILVLLKATNTLGYFQEKAGDDDIPPDSDKFVMHLQAKLPGKVIEATHEFREYNGKNQMNWTNFKKYSKGGGSAPKTAENTGNSDW